MNSDSLVVFVSIPRDESKRFARTLVEQRLAACVNICPRMESYYRWEGKVLADEEALMIIKTTKQRFADLQEYVNQHHPYDLPELIGLPVTDGLPAYVDWIRTETE